MKQTINFYDFQRAFQTMDRKENFSYDGLKLLFDYLEEYEESTGEDIELDVIALCCDYRESTTEKIIEDYSLEIEEEDNPEEVIENYLNEETVFLGKTSDNTFLYEAF